MLRVQNILVPVEIDANAAPVVRWAVVLAQATGSHLTLLHVNEALELLKQRPAFAGFPGTATTLEEWRSSYEQATRLELACLVEQYCTGIATDIVLMEGRAHQCILEHIGKTPCDLVVLGTHGKPWYQRLLLGSTAEAVLRASSVPMLIVHNTAAPQKPPRLKTVLLPTDLSVSGTVGAEWGILLAAHGVEKVILVHTIENPLLDVYNPDAAEIDLRQLMEDSRQHPPRSAQPFWEHARQIAQAQLALLQHPLQGTQVHVAVQVREGSAAEEILSVAASESPDLIVMATHGRSGVRRLLLGSVTEKIVRTAPCPVLAVPSRE
jgi:nucleotide-binding universal stress UspA family protein